MRMVYFVFYARYKIVLFYLGSLTVRGAQFQTLNVDSAPD
jgi:hypothetical protein